MKRIFILIAGMLLLGSLGWGVESILIDFSQLIADSEEFEGQHERTRIDFSEVPIPTLAQADREGLSSSLFIENWNVTLASSSRATENVISSFARQAQVSDNADQFAGQAVMGIRVRFPESDFNSYADIEPPFEIPAFDPERRFYPDDEGEPGFGVIGNVGPIQQIRLNAYGLNFPHRISVLLQDQDNRIQEVMMGDLEFDGWNTLVWNNPNYISDVRDRELQVTPMYPRTEPLRRVAGFRIYRAGSQIGGDFVTYLKDVVVVHDQAMLPRERDIEHEEVWNILTEREDARRQNELQRLGRQQALEFLERQLLHEDDDQEAEE